MRDCGKSPWCYLAKKSNKRKKNIARLVFCTHFFLFYLKRNCFSNTLWRWDEIIKIAIRLEIFIMNKKIISRRFHRHRHWNGRDRYTQDYPKKFALIDYCQQKKIKQKSPVNKHTIRSWWSHDIQSVKWVCNCSS